MFHSNNKLYHLNQHYNFLQALVFGYFCIGYVIGSIIYWLYKLYEYIVFRVNYTVFTSYYVYRIRKNKTWHDSLLTYTTEQYIIERRKRYHIFDKYEQLYTSTTTAEEAYNMLTIYINDFAENNELSK